MKTPTDESPSTNNPDSIANYRRQRMKRRIDGSSTMVNNGSPQNTNYSNESTVNFPIVTRQLNPNVQEYAPIAHPIALRLGVDETDNIADLEVREINAKAKVIDRNSTFTPIREESKTSFCQKLSLNPRISSDKTKGKPEKPILMPFI